MIEGGTDVEDDQEQQNRPAEAMKGAQEELPASGEAAFEAAGALSAGLKAAGRRELPGLELPGLELSGLRAGKAERASQPIGLQRKDHAGDGHNQREDVKADVRQPADDIQKRAAGAHPGRGVDPPAHDQANEQENKNRNADDHVNADHRDAGDAREGLLSSFSLPAHGEQGGGEDEDGNRPMQNDDARTIALGGGGAGSRGCFHCHKIETPFRQV